MRVAITGGSGTLGQAVIERLVAGGADRIVAFSRDEIKRLRLQQRFGGHAGVRVFAGDVRDADRMADMFAGCEVVIHAAARKRVDGHHDEAREMLRTNVEGTLNVVTAARRAGVHKLLLVSSDKAVQAENVYGVSKAMAEWLVVSENARTHATGLRLGAVRYGNVLASTGSVLHAWAEQLARGEALAVSDVRMTRFWLPVSEAVDVVLDAVGNLRGGEIFVPHLPAAPLTALADAAFPGVALRDMGIRPGGEKLHERLVGEDEVRRTVRRGRFYVVTPTRSPDSWDAQPWPGTPVPADFSMRSDTWPHQCSVADLRALLARTGLQPGTRA